jgi:hypothetical protein
LNGRLREGHEQSKQTEKAMKTHTQICRNHFRSLSRLGWLFLIPALTTTLPAQPIEPEMQIQCGGDGTALITCHDASNEWIVVSSSSLDGPWVPRLESVSPGSNTFQMTVTTPHQCEYFRLARGLRFEDDFNDGDLAGWSLYYSYPPFENFVTLEPTNGQLRISGTCAGCPSVARQVVFYRTNLVMADFAASIDVLGWDISPGSYANLTLVARVQPGPPSDYTPLYMGGLQVAPPSTSGLSLLWVWEGGGAGVIGPGHFFPKIDPARDYRLVFCGVGRKLTVKLYDLTDGHLVANYEVQDSTLTDGWVGFFVQETGPSGAMDFTVDNFRVVGTTP